ncbi:C40 family peptidase [Arthrobacter pigmenti]
MLLGAGLLSQAAMIHQDPPGGGGQGAQSGTVSASPAVKLSFNRASAVFSHPEAGWSVDGSTGDPAQGPGMPPGAFGQQPSAVEGNLSAVVKYAYAGLGHSYVWGGTSFSNGWDCSGFVQWAYAQAGIALPRVSQWAALTPTTTPSPGDLVAQRPDGPNHWAHVGIYVGDGMMISALNPDDGTVLHSVGPEGTSWFFTTNASAGADSPGSMPVAWQPPPVQAAPETEQSRASAADRNSGGAGNGKSVANRTNTSSADNDRSKSDGNRSTDTQDRPATQTDRQNDRQGETRQGESWQKDQGDQQDRERKDPTPNQTTDDSADKSKDKGGSQPTSKSSDSTKESSKDSSKAATSPSAEAGNPAAGDPTADDSETGTPTTTAPDEADNSSETQEPGQNAPSTTPTENEDTGTAEPEGTTDAPSSGESAPGDAAPADLPAAVVNAAVNQTAKVMDPATFIETVLRQAGYPSVEGPRDYLQLGVEVQAGEALPGDLLYYPGTDGQPPTVAVYLGDQTGLQGSSAEGPVAEFTLSDKEVTPKYIRLTVQP